MTVDQLGGLFRRHGVPDYYYVLDGSLGAGECYGIEKADRDWVRLLQRARTQERARPRRQRGRRVPLDDQIHRRGDAASVRARDCLAE